MGVIEPLSSLVTQRRGVVFSKLGGANHPELRAAVEHVGKWALEQKPPEHHATHWWTHQLSEAAERAFHLVARSTALKNDLFGSLFRPESYVVEPLEGMNEVYVASKTHKHNSDTALYTNHVDGPCGWFPFAKVYRCVVATTPNQQIETMFPLAGGNCRATLSTGDLMSFNLHREVHRFALVEGATENGSARVCLQLHYLIYPKALAPVGKMLGRMSMHYNQKFRITPNSLLSKLLALSALFEGAIGWSNVPYIALVGLISILSGCYTLFFAATSYAHYVVYICTYAERATPTEPSQTAYGAFKRDALLYKSLALFQTGIQFLLYFDFSQPDYLALLLLVTGFGLGAWAASALGVDRTYFGWELGEISGDWVCSFPYGYVPHPMIVGGCIGWLGFHKIEGFRAAWPYYAPLHVACYLAHAAQEHFAIHSNGKLETAESDCSFAQTIGKTNGEANGKTNGKLLVA